MARAVVLGGDGEARTLFSALLDAGVEATLVLCEPVEGGAPADPGKDGRVVHAKAVRVLTSDDRVAGLLVHADGDGLSAVPGAVALAGRRPTRLWTGKGGLGHGLALGLLSGADARGLDDVVADGPRGGLVAGPDGATRQAGLYALAGAVHREADVDPAAVAGALAEAPSPGSLPTPPPLPDADRPMPEGFAGPKLDRLAGIVAGLTPDGAEDPGAGAGPDAATLAQVQRDVRGLYGEMRSYLQARRSEELLDLRDAVVVALAVVRSVAEAGRQDG